MIDKLRGFWRSMFDVREGELRRTVFMALYLMFVLFAYYILKAVSRGMFLAEFDIDKLPILYIFIAIGGGLMAYGYTKVAVHYSLNTAVNICTFGMVGTLVLIWFLLGFNWPWMLYVFNVFVSLFSITLVSQGWLVAANVFTTREAKRLYGILGLGSVIGAAFGGSFTAFTVHYVGTRNLLLASAAVVGLAYASYLFVIRQAGVRVREAKGAEEEEEFRLTDITRAIASYRHLQVIVAIITLTYVVDVTVEYQFSAIAKQLYPDRRQLTAFLGTFFGIWLNLATFTFQFFLTAVVVSRFGVGGALQIMPVSIGLASIATFAMPGMWSTGAARLTEAATRYTFNKTGMELLYLPLPSELRNRVKAFVDIFVDRFARGVGGILLVFLTGTLNLGVKGLSVVVIGYAAIWIVLSLRAKQEYIKTVRTRLASRRLDLESLRINVNEAATIRLLEETASADNARQAAYALTLLSEADGYRMDRLIETLVDSKFPEVRAVVYELALKHDVRSLYDQAIAEVRSSRVGDDSPVVRPAVSYALQVSEDTPELAKRLLDHPNRLVSESALEALAEHPEAAQALITREWVAEAAKAPDPARRTLAAVGARIQTDRDPGILQTLLRDTDSSVAAAAARSAAQLNDRIYLEGLLHLLPGSKLRGVAIESLAAFGERIVGTLGDVLLDTTTPPAVRKQIPRVLRKIPGQRSVDILLRSAAEPDLSVRSAVLKSLNVLRQEKSDLLYGKETVMQNILSEVRYYYELNAALDPLKDQDQSPAGRLLATTIRERLRGTLERLFRLLGLRYPAKEMYAAYLSLNRPKSDEFTAAIEFLDNVLDRELKRVLLPLLDDNGRVSQSGRELFNIQEKDADSALRDLMRSGDSWLIACAVAAAAEWKMTQLRGEIESLSRSAGTEVGQVARAAVAALA